MSNKITAEKLIEDRRGIDALLKGFETVDLTGGDDLTTFRTIIGTYKTWASELSNDNILDVARTVESVLGSETARQQLLTYRVDHLRKLGIFEISEEEVRRQKAERNKQRAMAKRLQMEQLKNEEMRKAAEKENANSNDEISDSDKGGAASDSDGSS